MKKIFITLLVACTFMSCNDYLEVEEKGKVIPQTIEDMSMLMADYGKFSRSTVNLMLINDEIKLYEDEVGSIMWDSERFINGYKWLDFMFPDPDVDDPDWTLFYSQIYICNVVLDRIDEAKGSDEELRATTKGDALAQRAFAYFMLVNEYAKHYDTSSSSTDLGVPLYLEPDINTLKGRSSVQEVYDQIEEDLLSALALVPEAPSFSYHPGKAGVHGLLAKMYLYQGNWTKAFTHADEALKIQSFLYDYNDYGFHPFAPPFAGIFTLGPPPGPGAPPAIGPPFPTRAMDHQEAIWHKEVSHSIIMYGNCVYMSDEHNALYETGDRRKLFRLIPFERWGTNANGPHLYTKESYYKAGIYTPELYLIRAEANARMSRPDDAIADLNTLREHRISSANYVAYTPGKTDKEALDLVLKERRVEMLQEAWRWFDVKRLNKEADYQRTLTRDFQGQTYTLAPGDDNYVMAIPKKVITLNPLMEQNPRDGVQQ